jgi:hypothetical protein
MATRTANTGSNNWNTNGAWVGGVQPTAADDVVIPASATVTMPAATTSLCRSLTVQAGGVLVSAATTSAMTIGDGTAGAGNVAISISSTATITLTGVGTWTLASTSATQQTIASGGKILPSLAFNGAGSSYILSASLTGGLITLLAGTFDTGNFNLTTSAFNYGATAARTLTLGSSTWSFTGAGSNFVNGSAITNLTVTANTATFNFNSGGGFSRVIGRNLNWNGASFTMGSTANGGIEFQDMGTWVNFTRTGLAQKADSNFWWTGTATFTGTFTLTGNSVINRMYITSATRGTLATISATAVSLSNIDFMDIAGSGAATWAGTSLGDCQGNSNITFSAPIAQTHSSGTGTWSTMTWTSRVPLPQDDVVINGTGTITQDMPRIGKNIDFTGFTGTYTGGANWEGFGSYTLSPGMTYGPLASGGFAGRGNCTITWAGKTPGGATTTFNGPGGTYTLQDTLNSSGAVQLASGTLNTNNQIVNSLTFVANTTVASTLILGTTVWTLLQTTATTVWNAQNTNLTLSALLSTIVLGVASANTRSFVGGGYTYGELRYTVASSTGILNITGGNTFNNLNVNGGTRALRIIRSVTTTIRNWNVFGTAGNLITIDTDVAANNTSISIPIGAVVSSDYISIRDVTVKQPYKFYAGANSTNVSGNTNVVFSAPITAPYIYQEASSAGNVSGTSVTATLLAPATANNMLVAMHSTSTGGTPVSTPSGWVLAKQSQVSTSTSITVFYKLAAGGETGVTITNNSTSSLNLLLYELAGFTGTPTLDVTDGNTAGGVTSLSTAGTAPVNAIPALAIAGASFNANPVGVTATNGYQITTSPPTSIVYWSAKPLTAAAAQSTTFSWSVSRQGAAALVIFKDVPLAGAGSFFPFF